MSRFSLSVANVLPSWVRAVTRTPKESRQSAYLMGAARSHDRGRS